MTKILIDEATVKLALEALESLVFNKPFNHRYGDVITALKALAEQPAQRTWIGLTDKQIADIASSDPLTWANLNAVEHYQYFARAIEAKLKEKNT